MSLRDLLVSASVMLGFKVCSVIPWLFIYICARGQAQALMLTTQDLSKLSCLLNFLKLTSKAKQTLTNYIIMMGKVIYYDHTMGIPII